MFKVIHPDPITVKKQAQRALDIIHEMMAAECRTEVIDTIAWYIRLLEALDSRYLPGQEESRWMELFARLACLTNDEPDYSKDDWADALINPLEPVDVVKLLESDDATLTRFCVAAAKFKRETYCDLPHSVSWEEVVGILTK